MSHSVIILEPEAPLAESMRELLTMEGFDVTVAATTPETMVALRSRHAILVVVSLIVPPLERAELLESLRGLKFRGPVAFTGDPQSADARAVARSTGHAILDRPPDPEQFKLLAWQAARSAEERGETGEQASTPAAPAVAAAVAAPVILGSDESEAPAAPSGSAPRVATDPGTSSSASSAPPPAPTELPTDAAGLLDVTSATASELTRLGASLGGAVAGLRAELARQAEALATARREHEATEAERSRLAERLSSVEGEMAGFVNAVEGERDETSKRLQAAEEALEGVRGELEEALERLEEARSENRDLKAEHETAKTELGDARSSLLMAVGSLVTNLPDPAVAVVKGGSVAGMSRALASLLGQTANKVIGQPVTQILSKDLLSLLDKAEAVFEESREVLLSADAGSAEFEIVGFPLRSGKTPVRVLVLRQPAAAGPKVRGPEGNVGPIVEDFKERLFSLRMMAEMISSKAESEKLRDAAKGMTEDVDRLVAQTDEIFRPVE